MYRRHLQDEPPDSSGPLPRILLLGWPCFQCQEVWVPLCSIASKSPIFVDPTFTPRLGIETIPALHWNQRYKYLGCPSGASRRDALSDLTALRSTLLKDSTTILQSDLAEWQKLDAFRRFLFPRVTFILKVLTLTSRGVTSLIHPSVPL